MKIKYTDVGRCLICLHNPCDCNKTPSSLDRKKTSEQKAYDFWLKTINENNPAFYRAGCEWMINYWTKKLYEGKE